MKIIYLTTHLFDKDFDLYSKGKTNLPNPAGQNFHGKLIRALNTFASVHVYSYPPAQLGIQEDKDFFTEEGIHYTYVPRIKNIYLAALLGPRNLAKLIASEEGNGDAVIVFDPLNRTISLAADKVRKKLGYKKIAVLTDDIFNITGVDASYKESVRRLLPTSSGSIALTEGLIQSAGLTNGANFIQPMLVESCEAAPIQRKRPYIYYGGALFEKDGTGDLLRAYKELHPDYDLIISGHGQMEQELREAAKDTPGFTFLGQISKEEHYAYVAGSALAINPRRYNKTLDENAVPSKVMEYLCFAPVIASTLSTPIHKSFPDDINWIEGDLMSFLAQHLNDERKFIEMKENTAKSRVVSEFGIAKTGERLREFFNSLND